MIQKLIKILLGAIVLILIALHGLDFYMSYSDQEIVEELEYAANIRFLRNDDVRIVECIDTSDAAKPLIIFSHGAPGAWDAFKDFMKSSLLRSKADLIAYDRPGYGGSNLDPMPSITEQASVLNRIKNDYSNRHVILVGHSYGGPICAAAAMEDTSRITHVMMIAPVIVPEHEKIWWFSYLAYWKLTKWMFPKSFQIAGIEKFAHQGELADLDNQWQSLQVPLTHIHGESDEIAPAFYNIEYSKNRLLDSMTTRQFYPDKGHTIIWSDPDLIINQIVNILERSARKNTELGL